MSSSENHQVSRTQVVAKALINVKDALALSSETVGKVIGADAITISRIPKDLDMQENRTFEAALLLIRIFRSLFAMLGGSSGAIRHRLTTENDDFHGLPPLEVMKTAAGLIEVVKYLDAQ